MMASKGNISVVVLLLVLVVLPLQAQDEAVPEPAQEQQQAVGDEPDSLPADVVMDEPELPVAPADPMQLPPFPPRSQFDDMLQRPLFHSSRRPQTEDTGGGSAQELRETWKLTGIVMVGDEIKALFQERNGDRRLTLGAGMPLDAHWILDEISPNTVILGSGDEQVTLELLEPRDTTPVAAPEQGAGDEETAEPGTVEERTRAASRQLEQNADSAKETPDE